MAKYLKGYKVVRVVHGECLSAYVGAFTYGLRYSLGKWTQRMPGFGPIALFGKIPEPHYLRPGYWTTSDERKCATHTIIKLFYCSYEPADYQYLWVPTGIDDEAPGNAFSQNGQWIRDEDFPDDTVFANRIKLLQEVILA
jgi:hypothetical protein